MQEVTGGPGARQRVITTKYAKSINYNRVANYKPVMRSRHPVGTHTRRKGYKRAALRT